MFVDIAMQWNLKQAISSEFILFILSWDAKYGESNYALNLLEQRVTNKLHGNFNQRLHLQIERNVHTINALLSSPL